MSKREESRLVTIPKKYSYTNTPSLNEEEGPRIFVHGEDEPLDEPHSVFVCLFVVVVWGTLLSISQKFVKSQY